MKGATELASGNQEAVKDVQREERLAPAIKVTPSPTPTPTFDELEAQVDSYRAIALDKYVETDPHSITPTIEELRKIPTGAKNHKEAQRLIQLASETKSQIEQVHQIRDSMPKVLADGSLMEVRDYLRSTMNDYDSSEFMGWTPLTILFRDGRPYWVIRLKMRAKNAFGAYVIDDSIYFIRNGTVERTEKYALN